VCMSYILSDSLKNCAFLTHKKSPFLIYLLNSKETHVSWDVTSLIVCVCVCVCVYIYTGSEKISCSDIYIYINVCKQTVENRFIHKHIILYNLSVYIGIYK
jgi:hypothetical protein